MECYKWSILFFSILAFVLSGCNEQTEEVSQEIKPILDSGYYTLVKPLIDSARSSIDVMMFLVSDTTEGFGEPGGLLAVLCDAYSRGVQVRVLLNTIEISNQEAIEFLQTRGIPVKKADRYSHTKLIVIDDAITVIGSHNWTSSAFGSNYEASILISDEITALEYRDYFDVHYSVGIEP